jgi:hypothetical protein
MEKNTRGDEAESYKESRRRIAQRETKMYNSKRRRTQRGTKEKNT